MKPQSSFNDAERELLITSAMENRGLKRADAEKLFDSIGARRAKRNPLLERQWVTTLAAVCDALQTGKARPEGLFASVFWIRLYGAITELRSRFQEMATMHADLSAVGKRHDWIAACAELFDACCAIRDSLSDDHLVYAAFVRHVHAHVYQNGFEYEIERGNPAKSQPSALRTKQMVSTVRRHIDIDEAHAIVDRVSARFGHDDGRIAVNFAHTVGPHVERLSRAMDVLDREREKDVADTIARLERDAGQQGVATDGASPRR